MPDLAVAVVGTGANGASVGADLTRAGYDVTFVEQWPEHVAVMREAGIRIKTPGGEVVTAVSAFNLCDVATMPRKFDIVLIVVKAYDTRWACELIKPLLKPSGLAVGLQNGLTMDSMADILGPERTIGAVIENSASMFEPGIVNRHTPADVSWFALGGFDERTHARAGEVAGILGHAGTVEIVDDIRSAKWMKLVANAGELVPAAILGLPIQAAGQVPGMREFMLRASVEAIEAALSSGHRLVPIFGLTDLNLDSPEAFAEGLYTSVMQDFTLPGTLTTVLQDWMKGRHSEVTEVNGAVVAENSRLACASAANAACIEVARQIEDGFLEPNPANATLLTGVVTPA